MTIYAAGERHQLGLDLNDLRTEARFSVSQVAEALRWSPAKVSRMLGTAARNAITFTDLQALLILLGASPLEQERLQSLNQRAGTKPDLAKAFPFLDLREVAYYDALLVAPVVRMQSSMHIPAPMQTHAYTQKILGWPPWIFAEVEARTRLAAQMNAALRIATSHVTMIMCESALWRARREQLEHLLTFDGRYSVHVFPFTAGVRRGILSPFTLLSWPDSKSQNLLAEPRIVDKLLIERGAKLYTDALQHFDDLLEYCEPPESFGLIVQRHLRTCALE